MVAEKRFTQEEVRYFLEQTYQEMRKAVGERMAWPLNLIDVIMPEGSQRDAARTQLRLLIDRMYQAGLADILLARGREFLGTEVLPKQTEPERGKQEEGEPIGFYAF